MSGSKLPITNVPITIHRKTHCALRRLSRHGCISDCAQPRSLLFFGAFQRASITNCPIRLVPFPTPCPPTVRALPFRMHVDSTLAKAGCDPERDQSDVVPPIHLSTTFERHADGSYPGGHVYSRTSNPTRARLEQVLADIEGATASLTFSSGMAATNALLSTLPVGSHVALADDIYFGVRSLAQDLEARGLVHITEFDASNPESVRAAMNEDTRIVWIETPSNPLLKIADIRLAAGLAHSVGALLVVDGTWTTPLLQTPLTLGADVVLHSVTKYLAGHSDVLGGVLSFRENGMLSDAVHRVQQSSGAVLDPFSSWLTLRGLRTLGVRLRAQVASAERIAHFLQAHPSVAAVHYPGLPDHPGHEVARAQMSGFGAMLSFRTGLSGPETLERVGRSALFTRATSLGGTESLIEHRRSVEGEASRTPEDLVRLSIGLEHTEDLMNDLAAILT